LRKYSYPDYQKALSTVHFPKNLEDVENSRQRLAFNELLFHQLKSLYRKKDWETYKTVHNLKLDKKVYEKFTKSLPYQLTDSQKKAIKEIFADLRSASPMNRLLEGDVGSGKTVVAAAAAFAAFVNGYQSVFMAPTQILAQQHYRTLKDIFDKFKVRVTLVTSAGVKSDLGKSDIFVGTHALIHNKVNFDNVAVVVIDEQHRFGVEQRAHLVKKTGSKKSSVHVLTMTATPIPRSVALTAYGDLALSTLTELPKGRKPITTWLVPPKKRDGAYGWIKEKIKENGVQAFIICPLIEESETESMKQVKAATAEFDKLKKVYKNLKLDLLHGRQTANKKDEVVSNFKKGKTDILVSTPVVEVGIDVPNATIMLIEGADRFGLAQLHQLRGRVGRGEEKSYCLLFTDSHSHKVSERLSALKKTMSGFELAELDLKLRGPGEIYGVRQHGFPELKIATWQDTELIKEARFVAEDVIENPKKFPKLIKKLTSHDIVMN
jgi:ATP-dependent DNA helicase RecG